MGTVAEAIIAGVIAIIFTIVMERLAGTAGLVYALVASIALYLLLLSRNSTAQPWWGPVTTILVLVLSISVGSGGWNLFVSPYLQKRNRSPAGPTPVEVVSGLVGSIEQVKLSEQTDPAGQRIPLVSLIMSIRNNGAPAAAEAFQLRIVGEDGSTVESESIMNPTQMTLVSPEGDEVIYGSDALYSKTLQAIPTGSVVRGRLLYFVRNRTKQEIETSFAFGSKLVVSFVDGFGRPSVATTGNIREGSGTLRFPGLTYPPPAPPQPKPSHDAPGGQVKPVSFDAPVASYRAPRLEWFDGAELRVLVTNTGSVPCSFKATVQILGASYGHTMKHPFKATWIEDKPIGVRPNTAASIRLARFLRPLDRSYIYVSNTEGGAAGQWIVDLSREFKVFVDLRVSVDEDPNAFTLLRVAIEPDHENQVLVVTQDPRTITNERTAEGPIHLRVEADQHGSTK